MRDVSRIDRYCDELKDIWKKCPDMRFGQLMYNLLSVYASEKHRDPFYTEDGEFFDFMKSVQF